MSMADKPSEDKTFPLDNGNFVHFQKDLRYGFWKISYQNGGVPDSLRGRYLSFSEAKKAFDNHLSRRTRRPAKYTDDPKKARRYSDKVNEVRKAMGLEEK